MGECSFPVSAINAWVSYCTVQYGGLQLNYFQKVYAVLISDVARPASLALLCGAALKITIARLSRPVYSLLIWVFSESSVVLLISLSDIPKSSFEIQIIRRLERRASCRTRIPFLLWHQIFDSSKTLPWTPRSCHPQRSVSSLPVTHENFKEENKNKHTAGSRFIEPTTPQSHR